MTIQVNLDRIEFFVTAKLGGSISIIFELVRFHFDIYLVKNVVLFVNIIPKPSFYLVKSAVIGTIKIFIYRNSTMLVQGMFVFVRSLRSK